MDAYFALLRFDLGCCFLNFWK